MLGLQWSSVAEDLCTRPKPWYHDTPLEVTSDRPPSDQSDSSPSPSEPLAPTHATAAHIGRLARIVGSKDSPALCARPSSTGFGDSGRLHCLLAAECTPADLAMSEAVAARVAVSRPQPRWSRHVEHELPVRGRTPGNSPSSVYDVRYPKPPMSVIKKIWTQRSEFIENRDYSNTRHVYSLPSHDSPFKPRGNSAFSLIQKKFVNIT